METARPTAPPIVAAWETTRACGYRCLHCRADAQPHALPGQLTGDEARRMLGQMGEGFPGGTLILTGGDPLLRADLPEMAAHATASGLRVALTPSATPSVTRRRLAELRDAGVRQVAISIDGATPEVHDGMRGINGSFARSLRILAMARELGLPVQVNSTVTRVTEPGLEALAEVVRGVQPVMWSVFFLVAVGRGRLDDMLSAEEHERAFHRIADLAETLPFRVKVTEAPPYRRVLAERGAAVLPPPVTGGRGFMFIAHDGVVSPSGFLPVAAGNVRDTSPVDIYRNGEIFRAIRDPERLGGKCRVCEYREVCGGSRARAWAVTGDPLAADPTCVHVPAALTAA
ncbi:MAG: radical SAM protein [Thermoleophilia bacterium]|nr:radical SAM protein [Thermoleophilia bacterium]